MQQATKNGSGSGNSGATANHLALFDARRALKAALPLLSTPGLDTALGCGDSRAKHLLTAFSRNLPEVELLAGSESADDRKTAADALVTFFLKGHKAEFWPALRPAVIEYVQRVRSLLAPGARESVSAALNGVHCAALDSMLETGETGESSGFAAFAGTVHMTEVLMYGRDAADWNLAIRALAMFCEKVESWRARQSANQKSMQQVRSLLAQRAREFVYSALLEMDNPVFASMLDRGEGGVSTSFTAFSSALPVTRLLLYGGDAVDQELAVRALAMFCEKGALAHEWYPLRGLVPAGALEEARALLGSCSGSA